MLTVIALASRPIGNRGSCHARCCGSMSAIMNGASIKTRTRPREVLDVLAFQPISR
jgi:hypothetical protein